MAIPVLVRRAAISLQRRPWRISSNLPHTRALSTTSGSDIARLSEREATRKALEAAARENRLDFQTAARILMTSPADERKFGWDFHLVQFFFACLPPLAVYALAQYSRYDQRQMEKDRERKIEKLIEEELENELGVELEEVAAMLNSRNPDLEALRMRLEAMEERIMRLEPALQQPGNVPPKSAEAATTAPEDVKPPGALQKTDTQKVDASVRDGSDSAGNQKKGEGEGDGHWQWWRGKRRAVSGDTHAHKQDHKADQQPRPTLTQMKQDHQ